MRDSGCTAVTKTDMAIALSGAYSVIWDTHIKQIFTLIARQLQIMKSDMTEYTERN